MEIIAYIYIFMLGCILGSFYNVVGYRIPANQSIVKPRSHCPNCNHYLSSLELIPVVSYIFLGGKCKECKTKISPFYPIMEFITGILFLISLLLSNDTSMLLVSLTLISLLVIITVSDIHYQIIPDKVLIFFSGLFIIEFLIFKEDMLNRFLQSAIAFVLLAAFALIIKKILKKDGIGGGDLKLFVVLTFVLTWQHTLLMIFIASLLCLLYILILKKKGYVAFGPFIAISTIIVWFYGQNILDVYLSLFI